MGLGIVGAPATVPTLDAAEGVVKRYPEPHGQVTAYNRSLVH